MLLLLFEFPCNIYISGKLAGETFCSLLLQ